MSQSSLRNNDGNPFLYLEGATGSTAFGVDATNSDQVNLVTSDAVQNVDPTSANPSIAVQSTTPGNITFSPKGTGQSDFLNGDVQITAGNLLMQNTATSGIEGVIEFGGARFISNHGTHNTFIGQLSGNFSNTNGENTGIGFNTLSSITSGFNNIAIGSDSLASVTTGTNHTAVGYQAMTQEVAGAGNTAIGASAMANMAGASSNNTAVGFAALTDLTASNSNTAIGGSCLSNLKTGASNIAIGSLSGSGYTGAESSNIVIGNNGTVSESNVIRIGTQGSGSGQQNQCFIAGINGTSVTVSGYVVVNSSGQLGTVSSTNMPWTDVTGTSQAMSVNNGYIADNAGLVTLTLPATAAIGDTVQVLGKGAGLWSIAQNSGQTIHFGTSNTTTGVGGSLSATRQYDCVRLRCITANTDWVVTGEVQGNITVV